MNLIPEREKLRSMSRHEIQKLCKATNIKANMRTEVMIDALCDLTNGKNAYAFRRSASRRIPSYRLNSVQPAFAQNSAQKTACQQSESNTDAESATNIAISVRTTRSKAKDIEMHDGKRRFVIAGDKRARNMTEITRRPTGSKGKGSSILQEAPIPEAHDRAGSMSITSDQQLVNSIGEAACPPDHSLCPTFALPVGTSANRQPSDLLTPPSDTSSNANLTARISELEAIMAVIPMVKQSVTQIPVLQDDIKYLEGLRLVLESDVTRFRQTTRNLSSRVSNLEGMIKELKGERDLLRKHMVHSTGARSAAGAVKDMSKIATSSTVGTGKVMDKGKVREVADTAIRVKPITLPQNLDLPNPSPAQPVLGKRRRSLTETPDVSLSDIPLVATGKRHEDAISAAVHRLNKPPKKRARIDPEDWLFLSFQRPPNQPPTSTLHQPRSDTSPGFLMKARPAPTLLGTRADDPSSSSFDMDVSLEVNVSLVQEDDITESNAVSGPSNKHPASSVDAAATSRLSSKRTHNSLEDVRGPAHDVYDPGFFDGLVPLHGPPSKKLPFTFYPAT